MRSNIFKAILGKSGIAATVLLLASGVSFAQQQINLTAGATNATLPDGSTVPMWGYTCGAVDPSSLATCRSLNPAAGASWSPIVITIPTTASGGLRITLTNSLPDGVPTSLTIVGQLGGGLGSAATSTPSPAHAEQQLTWPVQGDSGAGDPTNKPPPQGSRVQSFSTQVAKGAVVTLPDWANLRPGTYLIESGTHPSIQGPMGLYGILVVTTAPVGATAGTAYPAGTNPAVSYNAEVPLLLSEIDPLQNTAVSAAVNTVGFIETNVWAGYTGVNNQASRCTNLAGAAVPNNTCYPPAVNYTPLYYLINGVAFDKTKPSATNPSLFATAPATGVSGSILVRLVNAGLRMHVPSIVGSMTTPAVTSVAAAAVPGFSLVAEDGNPLPGVSRVQSEVFMAAGKTYDVMIDVPAGGTALPIFDREGSLSANATSRDAGMLAYIGVNGSAPPSTALASAVARPDVYGCASGTCPLPGVVAGRPLIVSDPAKGVIANDTNVYGVQLMAPVAGLTLNSNGTFTYTDGPTSFSYCANGTVTAGVCSSGLTATVTLGTAPTEGAAGITCTVPAPAYTATATTLTVKPPGVLGFCKDALGYPLQVAASPAPALAGGTVSVDPNGGFTASAAAGSHALTFTPQNSQGTNGSLASATLVFPAASNLSVAVLDGKDVFNHVANPFAVTDYRWIIEEDKTFYVDPNCQTNPLPATCPKAAGQVAPAVFGVNFHSSYMPVVAAGCTGPTSCEQGQKVLDGGGVHVNAVCDVGNGVCRAGSTKATLLPNQVVLDPTKHYYISVLPGDAVDPGHAMGGAQIPPACTPVPPATTCTGTFAPVTVLVEPLPAPPAKLSVFVFADDHPLNGEHDGTNFDQPIQNEPGLGGFNITIFDDVGGTGDAAGQLTYDEFGQPLSNALAGTIDPATGFDACPITANPLTGFDGAQSDTGITGVITVCPNYESDGSTVSPLEGQAVVANLPPGRYGIVATPGADRIARGEEWLQTNTLDGGKAHDAFLRINEPAFFQEFGPAGHHVAIGFANPQWIADAGTQLCTGLPGGCPRTVSGTVTGVHMSRPSDERLYGSQTRDTFGYTQCFASLGSPDGADITFTKCDPDTGQFTLTGVPPGDWRLTIFDQWNDQIVDGISTPVRVGTGNVNLGEIAVHAWKNNLTTRTCIDVNRDGICQDSDPGLPLVPTNVRFRDGSISNLNSTDLEGNAGFNEVFPLFSWYVLETDSNRFRNTGTHVINDAGGPVDGSTGPYRCGAPGFPACGTATGFLNMARTHEDFPLPAALRVPGAIYCDNADCTGISIANGPGFGGNSGPAVNQSTGRIDPAWVTSYGWQSFAGQNQFIEFGKAPFAAGENGGIRGHVVYASTRPFDDPALLLQLTWEPMVPHVTINLYQVGTAPDGSQSLTKVDSTQTSSWDDWAQGFYPGTSKPYMNCPGQSTADLFYFTLQNQPNYLDWYNSQHGGPAAKTVPNGSQYKCYDGMHNWNQLQPAPYDGMYKFPSIVGRNPTTGVFTTTNCTICAGRDINGDPLLPAGKYVVEMVVPTGYELVKEEDKNILLGDTYEGPVTSQFAGFGNIFIIPDQASIAANYNPNNALIPNTNLGADPRHEGDTGSVETFWPCVGASRVVPDYMSLFPLSGQNSPFAGATRNLCDRKLVTLEDQMSVLAKFYVFSSTHVAGHYTGVITDDFTSEFDVFSPHFGEKGSPANLPVAVKDWAGNEIARVYSDQWGTYNGLNYSTFSVNPPDPSGYIPAMMVMCMNDRGNAALADPLYQEAYSQFCYELPFMPGQTGYFDTPVIPVSAFASDYNHPDCAYPDATPAISQVNGDGAGPWVSAAGHTLTITALGNQTVNNYNYSGPGATAAPFNAKTVVRHYGFGPVQGTGSVKIDGITAPVVTWGDTSITVTVPAGVPNCAVQQQLQYSGGATTAQCGELIVTAGNGKQSIDTVTVTIGGKAPTHVAATGSIQSAIDAANPGDLIMVDPGNHHELLQMWKPVRLQGVGAASSVIDANAHPAGILTDWRLRVVCLFGLSPTGTPAGWSTDCETGGLFGSSPVGFNATGINPQIDRMPLEAVIGWDATLNGNLAEQLQEPTLLGAYEGAAITVMGKGVRFPSSPWDPALEASFPDGTALLTSSTSANNCGANTATAHNQFPSNFQCNPSRIDGLSITNSSQGGGGIFVHGWAHNLEIANNRVNNNQGTLAGGISIGTGEHPEAYLQGGIIAAPGSCQTNFPTNTQQPYCFNLNVKVHHNSVTNNASEGDELFAATPSGAGGVAFCTGADNYQFNYNWVCGNLSTGDGAGVSQLGFVYNGSINHNQILFNQATNPTTPSNGGGLLVMSAPDTDPACPGEADADCSHAFGVVGDGAGPGLVINANLIMGNAAEAGSGGGVRFQQVNGAEVGTFRTTNSRWYGVTVTNNVIANNVAGWDGAGVSLLDSLKIDLINNTIISNDSTATSGVLFASFYAPQASSPTPCARDAQGTSIRCVLSNPQPSGVSSGGHSAEFLASITPPAITGPITCPTGHGTTSGNACRRVSFPILYNDLIWQNRSFNIDISTTIGAGAQQQTVLLVPTLNQTTTGACPTTNVYWDLGLRGDTSPILHQSGVIFTPQASVLTSVVGYTGGGTGFKVNSDTNPLVVRQYCNGSKIPPEAGKTAWYQVPPGTNEGNVPTPIFNLTAGATVDEGNNWINISWGPLSLTRWTAADPNVVLADYSLTSGSPARNYITAANSSTTYAAAPALDYFDHVRKADNASDVGAIDFGAVAPTMSATVTPTTLAFGNWTVGTTSNVRTVTVTNTGNVALTLGTFTTAAPFTQTGGTCTATLAVGASCTVGVTYTPSSATASTGALAVAYPGATVTGSPVTLTGTGLGGARAAMSITPATALTITVATPFGNAGTGTGVVTLTNTAAAGGSQVSVTNVTVTGGSNGVGWLFAIAAGAGSNTCTGAALAPGASCTVTVRFTNTTAAVNVNRNGTITFTDTGLASPQSRALVGHAN